MLVFTSISRDENVITLESGVKIETTKEFSYFSPVQIRWNRNVKKLLRDFLVVACIFRFCNHLITYPIFFLCLYNRRRLMHLLVYFDGGND